MRGVFISFEGPEGSGKSTQAAILCERLRAEGRDVVTAREPGGTAIGEAVRRILQSGVEGEIIQPESEVFLFAACRAQLVRSVIEPALARGAWVVCDRFIDSTTAYQGYGREFDVDAILRINDFAVGSTMPDLTLLLDVEVEIGFERLAVRHRENHTECDRIEREDTEFHRRVRAGYLELAERWPDRIRLVRTNRQTGVVSDLIWEAAMQMETSASR